MRCLHWVMHGDGTGYLASTGSPNDGMVPTRLSLNVDEIYHKWGWDPY